MSGLDVIFAWAGPTGWALVAATAPLGITLSIAFAVFARILRAVTTGGAVAGGVVTFLLWISWPPSFAVLLVVFVLTWAATRAGYYRKQRLGTAERRSGRSAAQVLANLGAATGAALLATYARQPLLMFACAGALAEAGADTVSSEMGQALGAEPVLITSLKPVPVGSNGGVSGPGTLAGIAAAAMVAGAAVLTHIVPGYGWAIAAVSGICGMLFDSLLGATLEARRILNNDQVNFSSTFFAAALALLLARLWVGT